MDDFWNEALAKASREAPESEKGFNNTAFNNRVYNNYNSSLDQAGDTYSPRFNPETGESVAPNDWRILQESRTQQLLKDMADRSKPYNNADPEGDRQAEQDFNDEVQMEQEFRDAVNAGRDLANLTKKYAALGAVTVATAAAAALALQQQQKTTKDSVPVDFPSDSPNFNPKQPTFQPPTVKPTNDRSDTSINTNTLLPYGDTPFGFGGFSYLHYDHHKKHHFRYPY